MLRIFIASACHTQDQHLTCNDLAAHGNGVKQEDGRCLLSGDLLINQIKTASLPEGLTVQGNLTIKGSRIRQLPKGLVVEGNLSLYKTLIGSLPEDLVVLGSFYSTFGLGSPTIWCHEIPDSVIIQGRNEGCGI